MSKETHAPLAENGVITAGVIAAAAVGALAAVPSVSHAAVTDKIVNLTTTMQSSNTAADGNIFIDFSTMSASTSLSALPIYQYRISAYIPTITAVVDINSLTPDGMISNNATDKCQAPARLGAGSVIGPSGTLLTGQQQLQGNIGDWEAGQRGYVGLSFQLNGQTHYGWADVETIPTDAATLYHFGYETTPDTAIITPSFVAVPEASPLELLALGAVALGAFRLATAKRKDTDTTVSA